jgi:hypothetical protein
MMAQQMMYSGPTMHPMACGGMQNQMMMGMINPMMAMTNFNNGSATAMGDGDASKYDKAYKKTSEADKRQIAG